MLFASLLLLQSLSSPRPPPSKPALLARWLVSESGWGVVSAVASEEGESKRKVGYPFGKVVNLADGFDEKSGGMPLFFLADFQELVKDAEVKEGCDEGYKRPYNRGENEGLKSFPVIQASHGRASLSISEKQLLPSAGSRCWDGPSLDPQYPLCSHLNLQGTMEKVEGEENVQKARKRILDRHPEMGRWIDDHKFEPWILKVAFWVFRELN